MSNQKRNTLNKIFYTLLAFILVFLVIYKYGYKIPVLREIPFFSRGHEHIYKPVLSEEGEIEYWTCTMHPSVRLKDPGTCPICKMDLVPVMKKVNVPNESPSMETEEKEGTQKQDATEETQGTQVIDHSRHGTGIPVVKDDVRESKSIFKVDPQRQQLIGVKTEPVTVRPLEKAIRTVGMVELDETKITYVHTKISGWIEKVFVNFTLQHVEKGDPLFSIYSPELVSTQEEYLLALRSKKILGDNKFPEIAGGANSLLDSTRRRLQLWDISENQIREIERSGKVEKSLIINSPVTGYVIEKNAFDNMYVEPNTRVYTIADHSVVWVDAGIYESEISLVKPGQEATMTVNSFPGEEFNGKITYLLPHLESATRTAKIRMEFPNPDLKLLPKMYANVEIDIPLGEKLTVPESAVLRTGKQDIVFVDRGGGHMEMRRVELGQKAEGNYEVLRGLKEGEMVVSRANFLIDAESKIQAAIATWGEESIDGEEDTVEMELQKEEEINEGAKPEHIH